MAHAYDINSAPNNYEVITRCDRVTVSPSAAANRGPSHRPPERSAAKRRRRSGEGQARAAKRARIGGGHQSTGILSGFTGHEHDPDVGLINMKGRIYDPAIGRFISADPYIQYPFWGQGLNRYSYGFNNPMSGSDPTGFSWLEKVFGDSSGWEATAAFGGFGAIVGGAAYASYLAQGGSVSAGGLAGASGLGGAYAIGEAFAGLNDPGANATYARPTGELGQGALYYEGAGAAPPSALEGGDALACGPARAACMQIAARVANSPAGRAAQRYATQAGRWAQAQGANAVNWARNLWNGAQGGANFTRALQASDFGAKAKVEVIEGTLSVQDKVATVGIKYIQGNLGNPVTALNALKTTARQAGATTLRIEATIANPRLEPVLTRLLGPATQGAAGGAQDIWMLAL